LHTGLLVLAWRRVAPQRHDLHNATRVLCRALLFPSLLLLLFTSTSLVSSLLLLLLLASSHRISETDIETYADKPGVPTSMPDEFAI
jgi:hypothetical protein